MNPPKHLAALYAYAVNWCSERDIPLSWIRVWGKQLNNDSEMPIEWDGEEWAVFVSRGFPPRHPLQQSPNSRQARVWISASEGEFVARGLERYRKDWDLDSGQNWSALVLAGAVIAGDHYFVEYSTRVATSLANVDRFIFKYECKACGLECSEIPKFSPCKFRISPMLDISPITISKWEFFHENTKASYATYDIKSTAP